VEISPIKEFNEGKINKIIGKLYNTSWLSERNVPEINPNIEEIITTIIDSLKILLK
jgi:hypothetical protein